MCTEQDAYQQAKSAIKQAQALSIFNPTLPAKLDIHVIQEGFGWGLWQCQSSGLRFGMEQKKGIAQLKNSYWPPTYSALQAEELITETAEVVAKTTLPIQG